MNNDFMQVSLESMSRVCQMATDFDAGKLGGDTGLVAAASLASVDYGRKVGIVIVPAGSQQPSDGDMIFAQRGSLDELLRVQAACANDPLYGTGSIGEAGANITGTANDFVLLCQLVRQAPV